MMAQKQNRKKRILKHLLNVGGVIISVVVFSSASFAVDSAEAASQVIGSEGGQKAGKEALNTALKVAKSKPALSAATGIVCLACIPVAGAAASPVLCISCGILIAKTFG